MSTPPTLRKNPENYVRTHGKFDAESVGQDPSSIAQIFLTLLVITHKTAVVQPTAVQVWYVGNKWLWFNLWPYRFGTGRAVSTVSLWRVLQRESLSMHMCRAAETVLEY